MAIHDHFHVWRMGLAADRPATPAKDMGWFSTDTLRASIYDATAAAWRELTPNQGYPLFAASPSTTFTWMPGNSYVPFGDTGQVNKHHLDFTRYREARLYVRGFLKNIVTGAMRIKLVDLTNSVDLTPAIQVANVAAGAWVDRLTSWTALNSATYTNGDAYFEAQGYTDDDPLQQFVVGTIELELRG